MPPAAAREGLVVATHGRHCSVEAADGQRFLCHPRGKKLQVVVGDRVLWHPAEDEGVVERTLPRRNQLYRQDATRTKSFAANLDQVLIVLAAEPEFSERFLARALIACAAARIAPLIALNKADLDAPFAAGWQRLDAYHRLDYPTFALAVGSAGPPDRCRADLERLTATLHGAVTLILGPSGVGKSTLVNRLVPDASAAVGELSAALGTGTHTTTRSHWYWLGTDRAGAIIDSPGFQEFGLHHLQPQEIARCLPDFQAYAADCKFYNCSHIHEPGCAVIAAVEAGTISARRYRVYADLCAELAR